MGRREALLGADTVARVALFASLIAATRMFRLRLHVPGAGSVPWIALLVAARGSSRSPLAATLTGLTAGLIVALAGLDTPPGPQQLLKYLLAGAAVDAVMAASSLLGGPRRPAYAAAGAAAGLAKLATVYLVAVLLGLPVLVVKAVLAYAALLNLAFGAVAGAAASYIALVAGAANG